MLNRRYGTLRPSLEKRIRAADDAQLLEWIERFAAANALEEVFDDEKHQC